MLTMNVNGVKKNGHLLIEHHLHKYHIACIQETKFRDLHHRASFTYLVQSKFQARVFVGDKNSEEPKSRFPRSGGVATVVHGDFPGSETACVQDSFTVPNRYLVVKVASGGVPLYIHNVYAPNDPSEKKTFFQALSTQFEADAQHIVCGDFNTAIDIDLDSTRTARRADASHADFLDWLGRLQVSDAWRVHNPTSRVFSGPRPRVNRLDYIFLSEELLCELYGNSRYFQPHHGGDHLAHEVMLAPPKQLQGRGYWRFPRYLFEYPQVIDGIKTEVETLVPVIAASANPGIVWQTWKKRMRSTLQRICQRIQVEKSQVVKAANDRVEQLARALQDETTMNVQVVRAEYELAQETLKQVLEAHSSYNQDGSFDNEIDQTERSTSYFFRPPASHLRRTPIESVVVEDGSESNDPNVIALAFSQHWGQVMGVGDDPHVHVNEQVAQDKLLDSISKTLTVDQKSTLDAPLTESEVEAAIKSMSPHKAPGSDGLTAAFYQITPSLFAKVLLRVFSYQLSRGILLPTQRKSSVVLLFKKGSRSLPGNYRPIALIQVDVKILSRVLTSRLRNVVTVLVDPDQKGFVRGRSIHHHIMALRDLQHWCTTQDTEGYATFLDFEKAYDRVRWEYLFAVMRRMNIGEGFVSWVKLLLKSSQVSLMLNGWMQAPFEPTRGVKQGDPLSPLLFLLSLEPLCNLLRQESSLGLEVRASPSITATGVYFADDSTLISRNVPSLHKQLDIVQVYCEGSGAKLNQSKCVVLALNKTAPLPVVPGFSVLQDGESVKFLGVAFGRHDTTAQVIEALDEKIYKNIVMWHRRARTLEGRKLLANSVILSCLWHVALHFNIDQDHIRRWQTTINQFILRGYRSDRTSKSKLQLIPSRYLYQDRVDSGLQFPQIQAVLRQQRLSMLQQFVHQVQQPVQHPSRARFQWSSVAEILFRDALGPYHETRVTDLLWIDPVFTKSELRLEWLPSWWHQTWRQWIRQRWPVQDESWQRLVQSPLWLSNRPMLRVQTTSRVDPTKSSSHCLGMCTKSHRPFRRWYARAGKHTTIRDFVSTSGKWPSQEQFIDHVNRLLSQRALGDFDNYIALLPVKPKIVRLYSELTAVVRQVLVDVDLTTFVFPSAGRLQVPVCGVEVDTRTVFFPSLPTKTLREVTRTVPEARKPHPVVQFFDSVPDHVALEHLDFFVSCRRFMLPVIHDTMFRLLFRGLPVRSKFWFLQSANPDVVCCETPDCGGVETEEHLLFGCYRVRGVWSKLLSFWRRVAGHTIGWCDVVLGVQVRGTRLSSAQVEVVRVTWTVLCSVVLHHVWSTRNRWVFEDRQLPSVAASVKIILSTFASHLRRLERLWKTNQDKTQAFKWFRQQLLVFEPYASFYQEHPQLLDQRSPTISRCWHDVPR